MREKLFRGKRTDGEWVYGAYCHYDDIIDSGKSDCDYIIQKHTGEYFPFIKVEPDTVGQYTGLTDKNGKKIFEGDILSACFDDLFPDNETRELVVWDFCSFKLEYKKGIYDELAEDDYILWEVIGNIHDNPELLEVRE